MIRSLFLVTVSFLFLGQIAFGQGATSLSKEEQALLPLLDAPMIKEIATITKKVDGWKKSIDSLHQQFERSNRQVDQILKMNNIPKDLEAVFGMTEELNQHVEFFKRQAKAVTNPIVKKLLDAIAESKQVLAKIEKSIQDAAPYDKEKFPELTRETYAVYIKAKARLEAALALVDLYRAKVFAALDVLARPTDYARHFIEQKLQQEYLNKDYEVGDIKFKVVKGNQFVQSVFHEDANVTVSVTYGDTGLEVNATGLYFRYRTDGLPEPVFEKVKVSTSSLESLKTFVFQKGLDAILPVSNLGPIKIDGTPKINDFSDPDKSKRGSLDVRIALDFNGILDALPNGKLSGKTTVRLFTNRPPEVVDGEVGASIPLTPPVQLGPYLQIQKFNLNYAFKTKKATVETFIVPTGTNENVVSLDLKAEMELPPKEIKFTGSLQMGRKQGITLAEVECTISGKEIKGSLKFPGSNDSLNIGQVVNGKFKFHLDKKAFSADGMVSLFGCVESSFDMVMKFNGHGSITASREMKLGGGLKASALFNCKYSPGFRNASLELSMTVNVDLKLFRADAYVKVNATKKDRNVTIHVTAGTCDVEVAFQVDSLKEITVEKIAEKLRKNLGKILPNIMKAAARFESNARETLAGWEKHWRDTVSNQFAKWKLDKLETGNEQIDQILGQISQGGGKLKDWAVNLRQKSGKAWTDLSKNPGKAISDYATDQVFKDVKNLGSELQNLGDQIGQLFDPAAKKRLRKKREEAERKKREAEQRANRTKAFVTELLPLTNAINRMKPIIRNSDKITRGGRSNREKMGTVSKLRMRLMDAVPGSKGDGNGQILFTIRSTGFTRRLNTKTGLANTTHGSDVQGVLIEFTNFIADDGKKAEKPKAKILLPKFKHGSTFKAWAIAYDAILQLLERYHPELEIDGIQRLYDKQLKVVNRTKEKIHVWVLADIREVKERQVRWRWLPSAPPSREGFKVTIDPGQSRLIPKQQAGLSSILNARRVRLWAESESGERWEKHHQSDLWLVNKNPELKDERVYHAEQRSVYTYTIRPNADYRVFKERVIHFANYTSEPLTVRLMYLSETGGVARWRRLEDFVIQPRTSYQPRSKDGRLVRASKIKFVGMTDSVAYTIHARKALELVEETDGRRLYRAKKVGKYTHAFKPLPLSRKGR